MRYFHTISSTSLKLGLLFILLFILLLFGGNSFFRSNLTEKLEYHFFDFYSGRSTAHFVYPEIAVILAGEQSIQELGRWPWSRKKHATLLNQLTQADTVILDILFSEYTSVEEDTELIEAAAKLSNLVLATHLISGPTGGNPQVKKPIKDLADLAQSFGYVNISTDTDGLIRKVMPFFNIEDKAIPTLALSALSSILGQPLRGDGVTLAEMKTLLHGHQIVSDEENALWLSLPDVKFPQYEYVEVVNGNIAPDEFRNKIVIIGVVASGVEDFFSIPFKGSSKEVSGAELNAHMLRVLLAGNLLHRLSPVKDLFLICFFIIGGATLAMVRRPTLSYSGLLLTVLLYHLLGAYLFVMQNVWISQIVPSLGLLVTFFVFHYFRFKLLHDEVEVKSLSISYINELPRLLALEYESYQAYIQSIWPYIEKKNKIKLLNPKSTYENVKQELGHALEQNRIPESGSALIIKKSAGDYRNLAIIPLSRDCSINEQTFTVLGWQDFFEDSYIEALIAVALSSSWYFDMMKQAETRKALLLNTIHAITAAIDAKDPVTGGHSQRVSEVTKEICAQLNLEHQEQEDIFLGALIHDIGKIGVPDKVLAKPGKLTEQEMEMMEDHPDIGYRIMQSVNLPELTLQGLYEHHERFNGQGYPDQLMGNEISIAGRIIAVADVFDALSSDRPYRGGRSLKEVLEFMQQKKGIDFDHDVVNALVELKTNASK